MLSLRSVNVSVTRRALVPRSVAVRPVLRVRSSPKDLDAQLEAAMKAAEDCKEVRGLGRRTSSTARVLECMSVCALPSDPAQGPCMPYLSHRSIS